MLRTFLKSKIHRARVTQTDLDYIGSLTIDQDLLEAANIAVNEQVEIYNITRGTRCKTYAILGERGKGEMCINGAAAHLAEVDDLVIVVTYCQLNDEEVKNHQPTVVMVNKDNKII